MAEEDPSCWQTTRAGRDLGLATMKNNAAEAQVVQVLGNNIAVAFRVDKDDCAPLVHSLQLLFLLQPSVEGFSLCSLKTQLTQ